MSKRRTSGRAAVKRGKWQRGVDTRWAVEVEGRLVVVVVVVVAAVMVKVGWHVTAGQAGRRSAVEGESEEVEGKSEGVEGKSEQVMGSSISSIWPALGRRD
jgi:hypothetical protein